MSEIATWQVVSRVLLLKLVEVYQVEFFGFWEAPHYLCCTIQEFLWQLS